MALSRTVSEIDGDFSRKSQKFHTSRVFCTITEAGFFLELVTGAGAQKTRIMGLPGRERILTISSAIWIQYTNVTDGRMVRPSICHVGVLWCIADGRTPGDSKDRAYYA